MFRTQWYFSQKLYKFFWNLPRFHNFVVTHDNFSSLYKIWFCLKLVLDLLSLEYYLNFSYYMSYTQNFKSLMHPSVLLLVPLSEFCNLRRISSESNTPWRRVINFLKRLICYSTFSQYPLELKSQLKLQNYSKHNNK